MGNKESSGHFYETLVPFDDFEGFAEESHYQPLPDDWQVVLADIRGSTKAIAEGRYKDVNMMGAACITAVLNALKRFDPVPDIPYVFGGDGATLAVPSFSLDAVSQALAPTRALCEGRFGLELRIGIVPVTDIRARGRDVRIAKFRLSQGNHLAMFGGGGIELADALLKDEIGGAPYRIETPDSTSALTPDLEGLSCRWQPIDARNGRIVSVLVLATETDPAARRDAYRRAMTGITEALNQDSQELSPVADENLRFRWPPKTLWTEARATAGSGMFALLGRVVIILAESALQWFLHRTNGRAGAYDAPAYERELIANTDFRRFDDTLRLLFDCSRDQVTALETCLESLRRSGDIVYGLHEADNALMTCLVFSLERSNHVHFVDGGDGGFAIAAKMLKAQLAEGGRGKVGGPAKDADLRTFIL